jgi:DNA-binding transcriptional ArsR family regulator
MQVKEFLMSKSRAKRQKAPETWRKIIDECIAKALGNAFRQQILWILNERVASPSEIATELGESLNKVCHHISVLEEAACIELAYVRPVGNRLQSFYRATARAFLDGTDWPSVPQSVKDGMRATLLRNVIVDAIDAVDEGIYDKYEGSHMSWTPMLLDEQGREAMSLVLERALLDAIAVQDETKQRLLASGAPGAAYTVSILGYPAVGGERKVAPPTDAKELSTSLSQDKAAAKQMGAKWKAAKSRKSSTRKAAKSKRRKSAD